LGFGDATAIWFVQQNFAEVRLIDYYENSGCGLDHYVKVLRERNYNYGEHILPHDVQQALSTACGDHVVPPGDYAGIDHSIDYPCSTGVSAESVAGAAAILRNDPDALRLLRLRFADVQSHLSNLTTYYAGMRDGLRTIAKAAP
jgi:hypothetical protein